MENENKYFIRIDEVKRFTGQLKNASSFVFTVTATSVEDVFSKFADDVANHNKTSIWTVKFIAAFNKV